MSQPTVSSNEDDQPHYWWRSESNPNGSGRLEPRDRVLRELERLAKVAVTPDPMLGELRQAIKNYRCGDFWRPTGGIPKEKTDIPSVSTVLLVGLSGSGKSSLVNLMYYVLAKSGIVPFAQTSSVSGSKYTSMYLEEHNVTRSLKNGLCVYDSRGFDSDKMTESLDQLSSWMSSGVHHNQLCLRSQDYSNLNQDELNALVSRSSSKFTRRRVNCAIVVVDFAHMYNSHKAGDDKPLEAIKKLYSSPVFKKLSEKPILVLTHGDLLSTEERIEGRIKICKWLNICESTGVYDIVCLTEYGLVESDPVSAYAMAEVVYRALLVSDRTHLPKRNPLDWILIAFSWLMCFVAAFFDFFANIFSKFGNKHGRLRS